MPVMNRRHFLSSVLALSATSRLGNALAEEPERKPLLPTVRWGKHEITRLLVGHNPIKGVSHFSPQLDQEMRQWFAAEPHRSVAMLHRCQQVGINACQMGFRTSERNMIEDALRKYYEEGGTLKWIATFYSMPTDAAAAKEELARILQMRPRPIGVQQAGTTTDPLLKDGKVDASLENLKRFRDTGLLVGLGSHNHEAIDHAADKGWDVDFYQCSFYRSAFGPKPQRPGELFEDEDRQSMVKTIRQVPKPCIAFKVLGGNRHCSSPKSLEDALRFAMKSIKPSDVILLGMWQKQKDQVSENADLVRKILA